MFGLSSSLLFAIRSKNKIQRENDFGLTNRLCATDGQQKYLYYCQLNLMPSANRFLMGKWSSNGEKVSVCLLLKADNKKIGLKSEN